MLEVLEFRDVITGDVRLFPACEGLQPFPWTLTARGYGMMVARRIDKVEPVSSVNAAKDRQRSRRSITRIYQEPVTAVDTAIVADVAADDLLRQMVFGDGSLNYSSGPSSDSFSGGGGDFGGGGASNDSSGGDSGSW